MIALFKRLHKKHGRVFVILDNAGAHKSKAMKDYIRTTNGEAVLCFLPPRTPQHNPIEMLWRELKRAISNTFFGGSDEMKERITLLVESGEIPRIRLLWYMLEAVGVTGGTRAVALPTPAPPLNRAAVVSHHMETCSRDHAGPPNRAAAVC